MLPKPKKRRWIIGLCFGLLLIGVVAMIGGGWLVFSPNSPINQSAAIEATEKWARLAPLPATKTNLDILTRGSAFSRTFEVSFRDKPKNIRSWLSTCPGPNSVSPTIDSSGWSVYSYPGGDGAVSGEVRVSPAFDKVKIIATWS
jgi:hypothetical protein